MHLQFLCQIVGGFSNPFNIDIIKELIQHESIKFKEILDAVFILAVDLRKRSMDMIT